MKINFNQELKSINGETLKENEKAITLKTIAINAVLAPEEKQTGEEKVKAYQLALKINKEEKETQITAEEITLLKDKIGKNYAPLIVGQAYDIFENVK